MRDDQHDDAQDDQLYSSRLLLLTGILPSVCKCQVPPFSATSVHPSVNLPPEASSSFTKIAEEPFPDRSAKYLGQKERKGTKKADEGQPEKDRHCQAKLCGRENWRKRAWQRGNLLGRQACNSDK
jgi:hypothetical protein